jgi:hypothetical protein
MTKEDIKSLDLDKGDDDFEPEVEEPEPEPEGPEPEGPEPEGLNPEEEQPQETAALDAGDPEVEEVKSISVEGKGAPPAEESLFDDAPESIKKP